MAKIRIPEPHLPGIKALSLLSDAEANTLYELLRKLPKGVNYQRFLLTISENLDVENVRVLAKALFSMISLLLDKEHSLEEILSDLMEAYEEQLDESSLLSLDKTTLEERLKFVLLNGDGVVLTFRAVEALNNSNKKLVRHTDISSDVSLIFEEDYKNRHAIFIHNLKIDFEHNREGDSTQFLLDRIDLQKLKSQIEEALLREENIRINNQGIINFLDISE